MTERRDIFGIAAKLYDTEQGAAAWSIFTDDELRTLWAACCDIEACPAYDDEVYDEMARRDLFAVTLDETAGIASNTQEV